MSECSMDALQVDFDRTLKIEFHGSRVTSDAGLLAYRELDEALGLTEMGSEMLKDWRTGPNAQRKAVSSNIMGGRRLDTPSSKPTRRLSITWDRDRIVRKADGGRRPELIRGIPVKEEKLL